MGGEERLLREYDQAHPEPHTSCSRAADSSWGEFKAFAAGWKRLLLNHNPSFDPAHQLFEGSRFLLGEFKAFVCRHMPLFQEPLLSPVFQAARRSGEGTLVFWADRPQQADPCLLQIEAHRDEVLAVAFSPLGDVAASASADTTVKILDATTGKTLRSLGHDHAVTSLAFSNDGTLLACGSDTTVTVWSLFACGSDTTVTVWTLLACGSDTTVTVWHVQTGTVKATCKGHHGKACAQLDAATGASLSITLQR
ncbi:quinon protein alcohol dehydrogenase-like superfamily [Baffinella frigidus]|nr:quinon protein alcohol dehydrogenase-like superfamily [Cryptophyta sp. CCMP2293]